MNIAKEVYSTISKVDNKFWITIDDMIHITATYDLGDEDYWLKIDADLEGRIFSHRVDPIG